MIIKSYNYTNTRPSGITHTKDGATIHNYLWNCDYQLRTISESDNVSGGYTNSYVYDAYGQLTRENNGHFGNTILYTYDNMGNITKAQKYNYTTGAVSGTPTEDTYTYSTSYPDRLASFNNKTITYDNNGCVKTYDGWTYTWDKGKLTSISNSASSLARLPIVSNSKNYIFTYNGYGQRTQKKYTYFPGLGQQTDYMSSSTTTYEYDLRGRLLSDTRVLRYNDGTTINKKFVFLYEDFEIVGVIFTNSSGTGTYYYDKNPRGDVIAILDNSGNIVVEYAYDAYGNCYRYYSTNNDLADSNPIRYRSYYYDEDTGLYYLNARYYNPQWRRFVSPDNTAYLDVESANGLNLYAYCNNDPVNYCDPSGHSWESFWNGVGDWFSDHWKEVVIGTAFIVGGALVTALTAGAGVGFMAAFGSALLSSTIQVGISVGTSVLVGGLASVANGGSFFDNVGDNIARAYMWGGIFSGGAQILGGGFRIAANKGVTTGRAGGIKLGNSSVKILSPDKNNWAKAGGTLIKFGKGFRIDAGAMWGLHMHILSSGHLPIGAVIAGFVGTAY